MSDIRNKLIKEINHTDSCSWDLEDLIYDMLHELSIRSLGKYSEKGSSVIDTAREVYRTVLEEDLSIEELKHFAIHLMAELTDEALIKIEKEIAR